MWAEQDTEILLRFRRRQRTWFFFRLGRRVCKETIVWLLNYVGTDHIDSRKSLGQGQWFL